MHVASARVHGLAHLGVCVLGRLRRRVAPIHLNPIDPPLRIDVRILLPVVLRAGPVADAGLGAAARVEAEVEALGMGVVDHGLHAVGEVVLLGVHKAGLVAAASPGWTGQLGVVCRSE